MRKLALSLIALFVLISTATAQEQPDIFVPDIKFPDLHWGDQQATIVATNNTGLVKYMAVVAEASFKGSYLEPVRETKSFFVLYPEETHECVANVNIPGNYGNATIRIRLYDVADTNDIVLPTQMFYEQPFTIKYHIPEEIASYFSEKITMPPRVNVHPLFDNEFSRVLPYLIQEGKKVPEIASMAKCDTSFVNLMVKEFEHFGYLVRGPEGIRMFFPVISLPEAEECRAISDKLSSDLATLLTTNLPAYHNTLDSLVLAGEISSDSNLFLDGGTALFRPYPTIGLFSLWYDLGHRFIGRGKPLNIYEGTEPCNAHIPHYMYAVQGGDLFNGSHFYHELVGGNSYSYFFGDSIPPLNCPDNYLDIGRRGLYANWNYTLESKPEDFMIDTALVNVALNSLDAGADSLLASAYFDIQEVGQKYGRTSVNDGYRYWFWNLVATRTLEKLAKSGVVSRTDNGQFRYRAFVF